MVQRTNQGLAALLQTGQADTVPATVSDQEGQPVGQAQLSEGEFVFSVPAIIALGEGDYEVGLQTLETIHEELRAKAVEFTEERGLGALV